MKRLNHYAHILIVVIILILNLSRFCYLETVPKGFNPDEMRSAVTAQCLAQKGVDAMGIKFPLFGAMDCGSPKPPCYMYPAALWVKIFGVSIASVRAFSVFSYTLMLWGMYLLGCILGGRLCGLLTLLSSSISPWGWMFSRMALESHFCIIYMVWGIYFFLKDGRHRSLNLILSGFFMSAAMYAYPPTRLHGPIVIMLMLAFSISQKKLSWKDFLVFTGVSAVLCAPMAINIWHKDFLMSRLADLAIWNPYYLRSIHKTASFYDLCGIFFSNFAAHLSPDYLFFKGGTTIVFSTEHFGQLSWLDIFGLLTGLVLLVTGIFKKIFPWALPAFLLLSMFSGIIPSALTCESIPHSLRAIGALPFLSLFVGWALAYACQKMTFILPLCALLAAFFAGIFLKVYFLIYPIESDVYFDIGPWFDSQELKKDADWRWFSEKYPEDEYAVKYYLMSAKGINSCPNVPAGP